MRGLTTATGSCSGFGWNTNTRRSTPTCVAARPTPRASCIRMIMRSIRRCRSSSKSATSCAFSRSALSPYWRICASASCRRASVSAVELVVVEVVAERVVEHLDHADADGRGRARRGRGRGRARRRSVLPDGSDALRIDVDDGGEPRLAQGGRCGLQQPRRLRRERPRRRGLGDELRPVAVAQPRQRRRAEQLDARGSRPSALRSAARRRPGPAR